MASSTIPVSKNAIVNILKDVPENVLAEIFWKVLVEEDNAPLTSAEKESVKRARDDFKKGKTAKWEDIE